MAAKSVIGRRFRLEFSGHKHERKGSRFLTEVRAGLATFFAMAYIVSVNAAIVSQSGGTCVCTSATDPTCATDAAYAECKQEVQQDLVTATAAIASLTSFVFGALVNLPISFAPGMGVNTLFTFQVVGLNGSGPLSYRLALTAVFAEGLIMVALTLLGLRQWLARAIPSSLKYVSSTYHSFYMGHRPLLNTSTYLQHFDS
jgi:AGZA family xanthine/uracil permease-like MFS transporter